MTINRLPDYLGHMRQAIADALAFTEGMAQPDFEQDKRTHQAVVMSFPTSTLCSHFSPFSSSRLVMNQWVRCGFGAFSQKRCSGTFSIVV